MLTAAEKRLALQLFEIGAVKFGAFRLKLHERKPDAPLSPIYIDLRILRSFPEVMKSAIAVYRELIRGLEFKLLADVPTAATPIVGILSHELGVGMISPRKEEKEHGIARKIDGVFTRGDIVLLVDDLITQADSKFDAIKVLEENGVRVRDVVVLIDREQGGVEELERSGYVCHSAFKLRGLLKYYLAEGKISEAEHDRTVKYLDETSLSKKIYRESSL